MTSKTAPSFASGILCLLLLLWSLSAPAAEPELNVLILQPPAGEPLFGELEFEVDIYPQEDVSRVEFYLDGELLGELTAPPFRLPLDVGQENRGHRFEVKAYSGDRLAGEALMVSPSIQVDEVVEAELQQLYVTVTNGSQRVLDLERDDFAIIDNGSQQETVTFARGDVRLTAALLIDSSASMRGDRLRYALRGAGAFIQGLKSTDQASLLLFSDRLLYSTPFSNELGTLTQGLDRVRADGGTALNDHLYIALKRLESEQGRRVVIMLTDGIDSHSALRMSELGWLNRRSRTLIYWIRTDPRNEAEKDRFSAWKDSDDYQSEYRKLATAVIESGGRIVTLDRIEDADAAFKEILDELREQYVLGYYPNNRRNDGSWHQVFVRLRMSDLRVRAQRGYVDY